LEIELNAVLETIVIKKDKAKKYD